MESKNAQLVASQKETAQYKSKLNDFEATLASVQEEATSIVSSRSDENKELQQKLNASQTKRTQLKASLDKANVQLQKVVEKAASDAAASKAGADKSERILKMYSKKLEDAENNLKEAQALKEAAVAALDDEKLKSAAAADAAARDTAEAATEQVEELRRALH